MSVILFAYAALVGLAAFFLFKNDITCSVRCRFIYLSDFPDSYERLPSYDEMLWHPKHWGRWTFAQWKAYIEVYPEERVA